VGERQPAGPQLINFDSSECPRNAIIRVSIFKNGFLYIYDAGACVCLYNNISEVCRFMVFMMVYIHIYIYEFLFHTSMTEGQDPKTFQKHCYWRAGLSHRSWFELTEIAHTFAELVESQSTVSSKCIIIIYQLQYVKGRYSMRC